MNRHGVLAPGVAEDLDGVEGVGVDAREQEPRRVRADGDEAQVERPEALADLPELRARRQVLELVAVVVDARGQPLDGPVPRVAAEPDGLGGLAGRDRPRAPQRRVLVEHAATRPVLAWQA